jgi:Protein phosphatase 2C
VPPTGPDAPRSGDAEEREQAAPGQAGDVAAERSGPAQPVQDPATTGPEPAEAHPGGATDSAAEPEGPGPLSERTSEPREPQAKVAAREADVAEPATKPSAESEWTGTALSPYCVGDPGRAAFEVVPRLSRAPLGRPDTAIDACVVGALEVRAASIRGLGHRQEGTTRQDDYCLAVSPDGNWLVAAVADGVSAGPLSHYAAAIVARHGCSDLASKLDATAPDAIDWGDVINGVTNAIYARGRELLAGESDEPPDDAQVASAMASTVCYAIIATSPLDDGFVAYVVAVGDTSTWVGAPGTGWRRATGGKDLDSALSSSEVFALPARLDAPPRAARVRLSRRSPLLIVSDGVGDAIGDGTGPVARFLADVLEEPPDPLSFAGQIAFARKGVDDERTGIAVWPAAG